MKKITALIIAAAMTVSVNIPLVVHADSDYILNETFNGALTNWSFERELSGTTTLETCDPVINSSKELEIDMTDSAYSMVRATYTFPESLTGSAKICYKVRPGSGISTLVSLSNNSNWITAFGSDNSVSVNHAGDAEAPYTFATDLRYQSWYDVEVYVDYVGKKFKTKVISGTQSWESDVANLAASGVYNKKLYFRCWGNGAKSQIDDVKVEQLPLGVSIESGKVGNIFDQTDNEEFSVNVENAKAAAIESKLTWEIKNDYTNEVKRGERSFNIAAKGSNSFKLPANVKKFGTYTMTAHLMYKKDNAWVEDNEPRVIRFSKILASNNGERNTNFGFATSNLALEPGAPEQAFALMEKAGACGIRDLITWSTVQNADKAWTMSTGNQAMLNAMESRDMTNMLTLAYGHKGIVTQVDKNGRTATPDNFRAPRLDEDIREFGDYCEHMVELTKDYVQYYEVWNEWDGSFNVDLLGYEYYVKVLKEAYQRIKAVKPDAIVLCNSIGPNDNFPTALNKGVYEWCDGFVSHGYMAQSYFPSSLWLNKFNQRKTWIRNYESQKGYSTRKNMYFNENGISTAVDSEINKNNWRTVSESEQAEIVARYVSFVREYELTDLVYWYSLLDSGVDPANKEDMWGVMYYPKNMEKVYLAKPAYVSIAAMNKLMNGGITKTQWNKIETTEVRSNRVDPNVKPNDDVDIDCYVSCAYSFNRGANDGIGNNLAVLWSETAKDYVLKLGCNTVDMYDLFGNKTSLSSPDGVYKIPVNDTLVYLAGDFTSFEETTESTAAISLAEYDSDKNIMHISGFANGVSSGSTVNADIYRAGQLVKQVPVTINNGYFDKWFSITEAGTYKIRLGSYAEREITVTPTEPQTIEVASSIESGVSVYVDEDTNICISGKVNDFADNENVSVVIVPYGAEVTPENIIYIKQLDITEAGAFSDKMNFDGMEGKLDIYIGATNAAAVKNDFVPSIFKVKSLDIRDGNEITASAVIHNSSGQSRNVILVISQYDTEGRCIGVDVKKITLDNKESSQVVEFTTQKESGASSYKAFIWNSINDIEPLFDSVELGGE